MVIQSFIVRAGDEERRHRAVEFLRMLKLNRDIQVDIKEYKRDRSLAQNRLMWSWYGVIGKDLGYDPEDLHEEMKARVLGVERRMVQGPEGSIELVIPKSTSKLKVNEMSRFLEAIEVLASSLGITLPHPDIYDVAFGRKAP